MKPRAELIRAFNALRRQQRKAKPRGLQFVVVDADDPEWHEPISETFAQTVEGLRVMVEVAIRLDPLPPGYSIAVREVAEGGEP